MAKERLNGLPIKFSLTTFFSATLALTTLAWLQFFSYTHTNERTESIIACFGPGAGVYKKSVSIYEAGWPIPWLKVEAVTKDTTAHDHTVWLIDSYPALFFSALNGLLFWGLIWLAIYAVNAWRRRT